MEAPATRRLLGYFLAMFLPTAALVAGATFAISRTQAEASRETIELRESLDTQRGASELVRYVGDRARDVVFVASLPSMRAMAQDGPAPANDALRQLFANSVATHTDIAHVRWLDDRLVERLSLRVADGRAEFVTPRRLPPTGDPDFRQHIAALEVNQVYAAIETPPSGDVRSGAVVRLGTPLYDAAGRRRGLLLVDYRAEGLFAAFDLGTRGLYGHSLLLDGRGERLHEQGSEAAGPARHGGSFAGEHPEAWRRVATTAQGQFRDAHGLWTFATVHPLAAAATAIGADMNGEVEARSGAHEWKIVSQVPEPEMRGVARPVRSVALGNAAALLLVCLLGSFGLARAWVRREAAEIARAHQEAREIEAGLRLILQSNPNPMMVIDRAGRVYEANPQAERVFGRTRAELLSLAVEDFVPRAMRAQHAAQRAEYAERARARPMGQGLDMRAVRADGSEFPVEISLAPLTLGGENYVIATVVDISSRRQSEAQVRELAASLERRVEDRTEELRRAESNLRLILESSANGLFGIDCNGCISFANPAASRMLGFEPGALIGRVAAGLGVPTAKGGGLAAHLGRSLREGVVCTVDDETFRRLDRSELPVHYATHPMIRGGRIIGGVVSFIDVTERRALDAARESALRLAERLAQARSEFLANMSHEIRTPLNGVLGLAQVGFRETTADDPAHDTFARILESGRTLLGVVDNVLDFSRIEAGRVQVEALTTELKPLVDEVLTPIEPLARAKGLVLRVEGLETAPARCATDPMRVKQVLLNLLSNAVKFTDRGEIVLRVEQVADQLRFVVRDTGIGLSAEQSTRIFRAFEQADSSTTRRFGGTGLGLAICKRITELMGGEIAVRSEVGSGSEFEVRLPYVEPSSPASGAAADGDVTLTGTRRIARLEGLRILLAEDNEVNQMVVQAMLRPERPVLTTVSDGAAAVERVRAAGPGGFDLVLMDIQMPGMDGYEATRHIHTIDPDLPVIGQTAHVLHEAIAQCHAAGMVAHLPKPIDRRELLETVMHHARLPVQAEPKSARRA